MSAPDSNPVPANLLPTVPGWAIPRGPVSSDVEAAFLAGAALNSLDNLVRADPPWSGAWRQRLALKCAAVLVALTGRTEDEAALRDAWHLRQPGADPGPAGAVLDAWKRLAVRAPAVDEAALRSVAGLLGIRWGDEHQLLERVEALARSQAPAPVAAAAVASAVQAARPDADRLGWWVADQVIARRMRWPLPVPLLVAQARGVAFGSEYGRGRIRPGGEGFERAICVALVLASVEACRVAGEIAVRAARLAEVAPKLRAKGAGEVVALLLAEDAVSGTLRTPQLTRWGTRRLFDRLTAFDAVQELSGRASFKLYGL